MSDPVTTAAPDPAASPPAGSPPSGTPTEAPKMPDGLPPAYWDQSTGLKTDDVVKDFIGLQAAKAEQEARAASLPKDPNEYKLALPEDVKIPDGLDFKFDEKDPIVGPILADARKTAHELKLDQAAFSRLLGLEAKRKVAEINAAAERITAEQAKLGDNGPARITAVENYLRANLDQAHYEAVRPFVANATAFAAIEKLIAKATATSIPGDRPAVNPAPAQIPIHERWYGAPQQKAG